MVNATLLTLCTRAWCIQILSALGNGTQARISPLSHELGAGRTAVSASIQHLVGLGFLKRNTGHGHPLRPEYLLTAKGITVSVWAAQINSVLNNDDWQLARRMWTLPVLSVVTPTRRYGEIRFDLKPVTDRALSQSLQIMCEQDWLCRSVDVEATPPRVSYSPSGIGKKLSPILQQVL